jgi:predicted dehydrogenase
VCARIFSELGAEVCAVLGSSSKTAAAAATELSNSFGIRAKPFHELAPLLDESLDAVNICTPPHLHFDQLLAAFDRGLPVLCEKPLFWDECEGIAAVLGKLERIAAHPGRQLFVNTSNAAFIEAVRDKVAPSGAVERFGFRFHTGGPHRGRAIAADLLPHGLSLLLALQGRQTLASVSAESTPTRYACRFAYGGCQVDFDFRQGHVGPSGLAFCIDGRQWTRVQEGRGASYRVSLRDEQSGELTRIEDPFRTYIAEFLQYCGQKRASRSDRATEALENMRLMAQILLAPEAG